MGGGGDTEQFIRLSGAALSVLSSFISRRAAGSHGADDQTCSSWFALTAQLI